jgi:hypothetical protein
MTVYRLIATPFGWIFQRQDVIAGPFLRDAMPLQAERGVRTRIPRDDDINAAAQSLLELGRTGGKIRTKRQRHKQKAKKTRRKRKNKNTSKRRNKPNKYSRRRK